MCEAGSFDAQRGCGEQGLAFDTAFEPLRTQALEENAFVSRVLIDQEQLLLGLEHEVGGKELAEQAKVREANSVVRPRPRSSGKASKRKPGASSHALLGRVDPRDRHPLQKPNRSNRRRAAPVARER